MTDERWDIEELLVRYCDGCDRKDWRLFNKVFVPDAVGVYHDMRFASRREIVNHIKNHLGGVGVTQHLISNFVIVVDDLAATSRCQLRAWHEGIGEWRGINYEAWGSYEDHLHKTKDGWRIVQRTTSVQHHQGTRRILGPPPSRATL